MANINIPFSGKRIRQDSAKLKQLKKRQRQLNRIGLSVKDFVGKGLNLAAYEETRRIVREQRKAKAQEAAA